MADADGAVSASPQARPTRHHGTHALQEVTHIFDLEPTDLTTLINDWGLARYRSNQLLKWVYRRGIIDPQAMTDLSAPDRSTITRRLRFLTGDVLQHQTASDGVQKLLVGWHANTNNQNQAPDSPTALPVMTNPPPQTECVMIPADGSPDTRQRKTACISSQVGCPVGCHFCASGIGGLEDNLTRGRIVEQVWRLQSLPGIDRITNVVFMGMGEPLANLQPVIAAIKTITAEWGMNISARRVTVSTVGLPAQIRRLADANLGVTLALSLHAPNDKLRRQLIPWAERVTIDQIIQAARYYFQKTGREVTLEYILLGGVNDSTTQAQQLARVAQQLRSNVNLIRYNEVTGLPYTRPHSTAVRAFERTLKAANINTHIRASRGRDIAAACGQLRHEATHRG